MNIFIVQAFEMICQWCVFYYVWVSQMGGV